LTHDEDRILVEEVLAGRLESFDGLVRKYQKSIFYLILRMMRRSEDADEVTQKTFLRAYQSLRTFRFQSSFKTWLMAIALNLARNEFRRGNRTMIPLDEKFPDPESGDPWEKARAEGQRQWLEQALETLPDRQREVIQLRIHEELSFKEIALVTGSGEGAAKVNFHHGMKRLKEIYERHRKKNEL
jgi:RNA polymerase sigma-70 factor, ECF subfamily